MNDKPLFNVGDVIRVSPYMKGDSTMYVVSSIAYAAHRGAFNWMMDFYRLPDGHQYSDYGQDDSFFTIDEFMTAAYGAIQENAG